ncbi:MAG: tyrosine-type recombinase/integrase [Mycobacterium sp.]
MALGALKNPWSRRSVLVSDWVMPQLCPNPGFVMAALRSLKTAQVAERLAAPFWAATPVQSRRDEAMDVDADLVFRTEVGTAIDYANQRRSLRALAIKAGLGEKWTTRELRHTAVSILSHGGVPLETIADLAGHRDSTVTASVYRHNLAPIIRRNPAVITAAISTLTATTNPGSEEPGSPMAKN